jgi:DNA repair protein RadD
MAFTPRDYQIAALQSVPRYFSTKKGHPIICMPTGTGKGPVIAMIIRWIFSVNPTANVMNVTHVKKLIQQNYNQLKRVWPQAPAGIFSAGLGKREIRRITFAGIASIANALHLLDKIDILLVDECDLVSPKEKTMYMKVIKYLLKKNPACKVIGLTATPWRMQQGHLTDGDGLFTDVCIDMTDMLSINWFMDQGYLVPLIPKRTNLELDVKGVHMVGGDFNKKELDLKVNRDEITEAALRETMEAAHDRKHWLIFACNVEHAIAIQHMCQWLGISCNIVHSKQKDDINDQQYAEWEAGSVRAIVNYGVLTTGVDFPNIDCIVMLRATASSRLWVQMLGRGTRPVYEEGFNLLTQEGRLASIQHSDKRNCLVLDFGRNSKRLGTFNDPNIPGSKKKSGGTAPVKECPACDTYCHASVRYCGGKPYPTDAGCGHEFKFEVKIVDSASADELLKRSGEMPIIEILQIDHIEYARHEKAGGTPSLKITYWHSINSYNEFKFFDHPVDSLPHSNAKSWWEQRAPGTPMPKDVNDALGRAQMELASPTHMRVWINKKYPEIKAFCYDGTAFNTQPASMYVPNIKARINKNIPTDIEDGDIPF